MIFTKLNVKHLFRILKCWIFCHLIVLLLLILDKNIGSNCVYLNEVLKKKTFNLSSYYVKFKKNILLIPDSSKIDKIKFALILHQIILHSWGMHSD